jgi:hypothetical protein
VAAAAAAAVVAAAEVLCPCSGGMGSDVVAILLMILRMNVRVRLFGSSLFSLLYGTTLSKHTMMGRKTSVCGRCRSINGRLFQKKMMDRHGGWWRLRAGASGKGAVPVPVNLLPRRYVVRGGCEIQNSTSKLNFFEIRPAMHHHLPSLHERP